MPPTERRLDPGVVARLLAEPHRFQFFQAVRVLEHVFVRAGARPEDVLPRRLRFRTSLSLGFPASEIEALQAYAQDGEPFGGQDPDDALGAVELTPAFMGLLGARGTLPLGYTERIGEREALHRDHAARSFLDIFGNRAVALFYAAWKKHRLAFQYELNRQERFLPLALALAGMGMKSLRSRLGEGQGALFDQGIAYYSALVRQRPLSAAFLQRALAEYFDAPLRIEQFAGAWYMVPEAQLTRLGAGNAALGSTALAGGRVWQRDLRIRLWFGPLRHRQFEDFLPGGSAAAALAKWLTLVAGSTLEYEVRLILHRDDVQGVRLGAGGGRLGWDAFIMTRQADSDRADASYLLPTI